MPEAGAGAPSASSTTTPAAGEPAVRESWLASTLAAFSAPLYRVLWLGSFTGFLAFNMSGTAQSVVAFDLTGSNSAVGAVMFGQGLAMLLLNPFGGAVADRFNKRILLLVTQAVIGTVILTTGILLELGWMSIPLLALGAFTTGSMFAFLGPARASVMGNAVPPDRVGNAMALMQVAANVGRILAPFVAGLLLAWSVTGASGTYFVIAAMFVLVLLFMSRILGTSPSPCGRSVIDDLKLGLNYVRDHPPILHGIVSYYFLTALGFSYMVLAPGFVQAELGLGTASVGVLLGFAAMGGLAGSIGVAALADSPRAPVFLRLAGLLGAVGLIATGLAPSFPAALAAMVLVGMGIAGFQTLDSSIVVKRTDPAFYGRVMGLMQVAWGLIHLTSLPVGALADLLNERAALSGAGIVLVLVLLMLTAWERRLPGHDVLV